MGTHILHFNSFESGKQTLTDDKNEEGRRVPPNNPCHRFGPPQQDSIVGVDEPLDGFRRSSHAVWPLKLVKRDPSVTTPTTWPWSAEACCDRRRTGNHNLFVSEVQYHSRDFCLRLCFLSFITYSHYGDFSFECKTNTLPTDLPVLFIFQRLVSLLEVSHVAFDPSHTFVYSIFLTVSCMGSFSSMSMALYCTAQLLLYIFILSISKVLEMLVLSMSTLMHLMSVWSYQQVSNCYVLLYSDAFIMPLALAAVVDDYLGAIYLLCALSCCSQSNRWTGNELWGKMWACAWFSCWVVSADQYWPSVLVQGTEFLPASEERPGVTGC